MGLRYLFPFIIIRSTGLHYESVGYLFPFIIIRSTGLHYESVARFIGVFAGLRRTVVKSTP